MRIRPILFNTDMVRAILDGRKTVTRRKIDDDIVNSFDIDTDGSVYGCQNRDGDFEDAENFCRYQLGDILYVRETWNYGYIETSDNPGNSEAWFEELRPDEEHSPYIESLSCYFYKADEDAPGSDIGMVWRPSIHMPKAAARIWLRVTDVRVERLQDMDTADDSNYIAEGAADKHDFIRIWDVTVKDKDTQGWYANPWVWIIEFERCEKPE